MAPHTTIQYTCDLVIVVRDGPTHRHTAPGVHEGEHGGRHLAAHVVKVAVDTSRCCLAGGRFEKKKCLKLLSSTGNQ